MNEVKHLVAVAVALCMLLAFSSAQATGPYIGGGITAAMLQDDDSTPGGDDFDESGTGHKFFGGYRFDWLPIVSLSAELGYRDLGTPAGSSAEYEIIDIDEMDRVDTVSLSLLHEF